jgi:hypothetical protein
MIGGGEDGADKAAVGAMNRPLRMSYDGWMDDPTGAELLAHTDVQIILL